MLTNRKCGTCTVCCDVLAIVELEKPQFTRCPKLVKRPTTKSCSVYASRPEECSAFRCYWLTGIGTNKQRPDRCGVMLTGTADNSDCPVPVIQGFRFREHLTQEGHALWNSVTDSSVVLEPRRDGSRKVLGPAHLVQRFLAWVQQQQQRKNEQASACTNREGE